MSLKIRRGTNDERLTITPAEGELIYTTDTKILYVGDGTTVGGNVVTSSGGGSGYDGSRGDTGYTGSKGLQGDPGSAATIAVGSVTAGAPGTNPIITNSGSTGAATFNFTIPTGFTGSAGGGGNGSGTVTSVGGTGTVAGISLSGSVTTTGNLTLGGTLAVPVGNITATGTASGTTYLRGDGTWTTPTAALGGTATSNISLSTYNITGTNLTINGSNGNISTSKLTAGNLTLENSTLSSTNTFIDNNSKTIGLVNLNTNTQLTLKWSSANTAYSSFYGISDSVNGYPALCSDYYSSNGTLINPTILSSGDLMYNQRFYGHDGSDFVWSSMMLVVVDDTATVNTGNVPGKIAFANIINGDPSNPVWLTFDSKGRLAVNQIDATETLDVKGTGKFSEYVIFGSYTTTQRNTLTAQNGMVIYNTSLDKFQGYQGGAWVNFA